MSTNIISFVKVETAKTFNTNAHGHECELWLIEDNEEIRQSVEIALGYKQKEKSYG